MQSRRQLPERRSGTWAARQEIASARGNTHVECSNGQQFIALKIKSITSKIKLITSNIKFFIAFDETVQGIFIENFS